MLLDELTIFDPEFQALIVFPVLPNRAITAWLPSHPLSPKPHQQL